MTSNTTALPSASTELAAIRDALAAGPTPGRWDVDSTKNDGEYGNGGPDSKSGFSSFVLIDSKGNAICDTLNSDVAEVEEWMDDEDAGATDERGQKNLYYMAACNPAAMTAVLAYVDALQAEIQALRAQYEARELEAHQLSELIIKLRAVIRDHNADCESQCEQRQQSGDAHCPYAKYGRQCPDCPRDGMLDVVQPWMEQEAKYEAEMREVDAAVSASGEGGQ
jgi:hypothetical protein